MEDNWHERPYSDSGRMKAEAESIVVKGMAVPDLARRDANGLGREITTTSMCVVNIGKRGGIPGL